MDWREDSQFVHIKHSIRVLQIKKGGIVGNLAWIWTVRNAYTPLDGKHYRRGAWKPGCKERKEVKMDLVDTVFKHVE